MHVQKVLDRLVECNLRVNLIKCQWFQPEIDFFRASYHQTWNQANLKKDKGHCQL